MATEEKLQGSIGGPIFAEEMGRGEGQSAATQDVRRGGAPQIDAEIRERLPEHQRLLDDLYNRIASAQRRNPKDSLQQQMLVEVQALKPLTNSPNMQIAVMRAARDYQLLAEQLGEAGDPEARRLLAEAKRRHNQAREYFTMCHWGYITHLSRPQAKQMQSEDHEGAIEVLRQESFINMMTRAIEKYDFDRPNNPLTYGKQWIRAALIKTTEEGRLVRARSKAHPLTQRVEKYIKHMEDEEGRTPSMQQIADAVESTPEKVANVLPFASGRFVRMDAAIKTDESESTIGSFIVDDHDLEEALLDDDMRAQVHLAVDELDSPLHRSLLKGLYGFDENGKVEQKVFFDGVYRDADGNAFSAESGIIRERASAGEDVAEMSQKKLNDLYNAGELSFEPGTAEAHEAARVNHGNFDPDARFEKTITCETGMPLTSGTTQEALKKAHSELRNSARLKALGLRYRGDDELENSESARHEVLDALVAVGEVSPQDVEKLNTTRTASGGKARIRQLAEKHGFVNPDNGRLRLEVIRDVSVEADAETEDLAELMSQA